MGSDEAMERDDRPEGLMELVLPGSTAFDDDILPPLHNSYLYDDSRKSFLYSSARLINNAALQTRYAAFRAEKRECGYTEKELEETFGFLLFDDESMAIELGERGLLTGHSTCSTLGDPSKGVYVSKYSDCLDLKPWYSGKSGHIAIMKLIKGRVKEVTENYTLKFTPPTQGFDTHESEQIKTVTAATSSFLAFERTQYYIYEILSGDEDTEKCPRHVYPFAIVEFSYGKAETDVPDTPEDSDEKAASSFDYRPWTGQVAFDSFVLDIGLKSHSGALIPAKLPETLSVKTVMRVAELKASLPKEVFETCFSGDIFVGGRYCSLYEVISTDEDDSSLYLLTDELKDKELALVFLLSDSGVFVILHSSYFLSYEDASTEETEALYGLFIFPDSHTIQKNTKSMQKKSALSSRVSRVLPALTYAETEVEKLGSDHHREIQTLLEQHLKNYGTLIQPGMQNSPQREASMFPDQYDVPCVFKQLFPLPKWTEVARLKVMVYFEDPCSFQIPVKKVSELISKSQNRDDPDDEVYYYISSPEPEEAPTGTVTTTCVETPADLESSSPKDMLSANDSTDEPVPEVSSSVVMRSAVMSEDPLKTNTKESPQEEQGSDSLLPSVFNGVNSSDGQSPEHDYGDYPEDSPVALLATGEDHSISDTEEAPGTPPMGKKPLKSEKVYLFDSSVGMDSATERSMEDNSRQDFSPTSGSAKHVDLPKDLPSADEAACSSKTLLEAETDDSTTKVSKDCEQKTSTSELKQFTAEQSVEECKASMEESTSSQPVKEQTKLAFEAEVSVSTAALQWSEDATQVAIQRIGEKSSSEQSDQASTSSEQQKVLEAVDSVPLKLLPAESSFTTKVLKDKKDSHTDKAHSVVDIADTKKLQAEAEVTNLNDIVNSIDVSIERLIKDNVQDNAPSHQKLNEDVCKSSQVENYSSPRGVCTEKPSETEGNRLTLPIVITSSTAVSIEACGSELSCEPLQGAESEDPGHFGTEQALYAPDKERAEKCPEPEDTSKEVHFSEKMITVNQSKIEDSISKKNLPVRMPTVESEKEDSSVCTSKSSADKVPTIQLGLYAEKPVDSQVTSVSSDPSDARDPTVEVPGENNTLQDFPSISDQPCSLSDVSLNHEIVERESSSQSAEVVKHARISDINSLDADTLPVQGDSITEMTRDEHGSEKAVSGLPQSNAEVRREGKKSASSVSVSPSQSADQGNSAMKCPEISQPAEQQEEDSGTYESALATHPGEGTPTLSTISTDHDKEIGGDLDGAKLPPSSDAAEANTDDTAESGTDQPLEKEAADGGGSSGANEKDKALVKPDWRRLPRRRGRRRKRLVSVKAKTTSKQQTLQSNSPPVLVPTETSVEHETEVKKQTSLENDHSKLSMQNVDVLQTPDKSVNKSIPFECLEHNYFQCLKETTNQISETSTEKSLFRRGKDGMTLYQRNKTQQRKSTSQVGVEIIIESKQVHRLKRKLDIDSLNHDLKTVITDCGKVFVPHGSEIPQDVELVMKRPKSAECDQGLSKLRPAGPMSPTESGGSPSDRVTGESRHNECLTLKDTKDSLSLSPGSRAVPSQELGEHSPKNTNVSACQVNPTDENPAGHKELECFPAFVLELDNNNQTQVTVTEQDEIIGRTDENLAILSSEKESSTKAAAYDSQASKEHGSTESDSKGSHKAKRKRSATYTVFPISELKTVFRAGKRASSSSPDVSGLKSDSKRHKGSSEDMGKESALSNEIVPLSELASTSTKKHNKLLKKWQKINAKDIFREDPLSFICPEELQGSDDGILVQIQLDSADNTSKAERKKARGKRPEEPPLRGLSSRKKPHVSSFRRQRAIIQKGESIEVSRLWKDAYDFSLDSKFRKNPRDETVLRALHGPWDFNITDSEEEIHLIFHMWIGLFYSKSAPRFFHLDSDYFPPEKDAPGEEGAKSPRDVHLQLSSITEFPPKASVTSTPKCTTTSMLLKTTPPAVLMPSDESLIKASGSSPEVRPESPSSYQALDLSLKSSKALDLISSTPNTSIVESTHSDPGVEQLEKALNEGPLDLRIEPVCARVQPQMKVDKVSEGDCSTERTADECTNTTTDVTCTSANIPSQSDVSEKAKGHFFDRLREDQNPVVTQDNETKYRFFILETSDDPFFRETREHLETDGHTPVNPDQFDLERCSPSSPLLIIMRNQDIAEHICEIPHLLELKTSPGVMFAGVDRPDDIRNLTHEELFSKGGFLMYDTASLKKLTLASMKRTVDFLEDLSRRGKWKWYLHYRDSRGLREEARTNEEARDKKHFLDCCQEAGLVEVLPYHDCDVISQERPDYLHCLVRLQVQNATRRFPVFMTDTTEESYKRSGIFTLTDTFWI